MLKKTILSALVALFVCGSAIAADEKPIGREQLLSEYAQDLEMQLESRVAAVIELGQFGGVNSIVGIGRASRAEEKELRIASIQAVRGWRGNGRWDVVSPLLNDPDEEVKGLAGRSLVELWGELNKGQQKHVDLALDTHLSLIEHGSSEFYVTKGTIDVFKQNFEAAHESFDKAKVLDVNNDIPFVLSAEAYKASGNYDAQLKELERGLEKNPDSMRLTFSAGLAYFSAGDSEKGISLLKTAADNEPDSARYLSTYAASIAESDPETASKYLKKSYEASGQMKYLEASCGVLKAISEERMIECVTNL